jgi:hypothetical protein
MRKRVYEKTNRNKYWINVVNKYGYSVNIVSEFEDDDEALIAEKELQEKYEKEGIKLCNLVRCGSKGAVGYKHNDIAKQKIALRSKELWATEAFRKLMPQVSGLKNPFSDKVKYEFYHPLYGVECCTQFELRTKYQLNDSHLSQLVKGKRFEHKKWRLFKNKDQYKPIQDNNIYHWKHPAFGERFLRKIDLMKEFSGLLQPNLCKLIKGVVGSYKGWTISKNNKNDNRCMKNRINI